MEMGVEMVRVERDGTVETGWWEWRLWDGVMGWWEEAGDMQ